MEGPPSAQYWLQMNKGMQLASAQLGVTTTWDGVPADDSNPLAEKQLIVDTIPQHPNAVFADDDQSTAFNPAIKQVIANHIPTFIMDVGDQFVTPDNALAFVGPNEVLESTDAGQMLQADGCKDTLIANLLPGAASFSDQRTAGFLAGYHKTAVKTSIPITDIDSASAIEGVIAAELVKDPKITCAFSTGELFTPSAVAAVQSLGPTRAAHFIIGAVDVNTEILQEIKSHEVKFSYDAQPFSEGYMAVVWMTSYLRYGEQPPQDIACGPLLVTAANVNTIIPLNTKGYH
jgi:simple sugar transport system substrate-binding protein